MKSMTFALVLVFAIVAVSSMPQSSTSRKVIPILQMDDVRDEAGQFSLRYVSGDGTTLTESGKLVPNDEGDGNVLVKEGSYTFTVPEGKTYTLTYVADKNGFQPKADYLPVAPVA